MSTKTVFDSYGPKTREFLDSLRSPATKADYAIKLSRLLGNHKGPDEFLTLSKEEKERIILTWIRENKEKVSGAYVRGVIAPVKSLCDYYETELNWAKIKKACPPANSVADDRCPTKEEIRKLLSVCNLRLRAIVLILASSGIRIGAFDGLKVGHYKKFEHKGKVIGSLEIYVGAPEKYTALISTEAVEALEAYLESRRIAGEDIGPDSPLIREVWDNFGVENTPKVPLPIKTRSLMLILEKKWILCGVRKRMKRKTEWKERKRHEFQAAHGFRKFFETYAPVGMEPERAEQDVRVLKGAKFSYYKPKLEHLVDQYVRCLPSLTISKEIEAKLQLEVEKAVLSENLQKALQQVADLQKIRLDVELLKSRFLSYDPRARESPK